MPNLVPPVVNAEMAKGYYDRIQAQNNSETFTPLMVLYLTDQTTPQDIIDAKNSGIVYAAKLYPAGATTNSSSGVTDINNIDAVIATNTTLARDQVAHLPHGNEQGGLSGAPVKEQSTIVIKQLAKALDGQFPIIGVGGIQSAEDAKEKLAAGASLVQLYTGFIYEGPALVKDIVDAL